MPISEKAKKGRDAYGSKVNATESDRRNAGQKLYGSKKNDLKRRIKFTDTRVAREAKEIIEDENPEINIEMEGTVLVFETEAKAIESARVLKKAGMNGIGVY